MKLSGQFRACGFTLIELMVTISILAILVSIAIPSFTSTIRRNQIAAGANDLVGSLNLARSEASKRSTTVTVCAANSSFTACSGNGADWTNGWLVFTDINVIGQIDPLSDIVVAQSKVSTSGLSIANGDASITFTSTGPLTNGAMTPPDSSFTITKTGCGTGEKRTVTVGATIGRISLTKGDCP